MKILIADDERMVRLTLKSMLLDLKISCDDIYEAKNGTELINTVKEHAPHIAFVDIKMPKLNGLDAIKLCKSFSPNTHWVILTGFSEFDYAKQAITLGVSDYLLKPISPETLKETIHKYSEQIFENNLISNKKFKKDVIALYYDFPSIEEKNLESIFINGNFILSVFYIDDSTSGFFNIDHKQNFFKALTSITDEFLTNDIRIALFNKTDTQIAVCCAYNIFENPNGRNRIDLYLNKAIELAKSYSHASLSITTIQSEAFTSYKQIHEQLDMIDKLSPLRTLFGIKRNYSIKYLNSVSSNSFYFELSKLIIDLCSSYNENAYINFNTLLKKIKNMLSNPKLILHKNITNSICDFLKYSIHFEFNLDNNLDSWIHELNKHGENLLMINTADKSDYIDEIKAFIDGNYMHDIGINTIAETLNITPNYLSALFTKKTGMRFTDYITEVRILKAKELLAETNMTIHEITEKVGYHSSRHFTKLFLKYTNCYPSEYKKSFK